MLAASGVNELHLYGAFLDSKLFSPSHSPICRLRRRRQPCRTVFVVCCAGENPFQDSNLFCLLFVVNEGFITAATDLLVHGVSAENTTRPLRRDASANLIASDHRQCPKSSFYLSSIYIIVFVYHLNELAKVCYKERAGVYYP